VRINHFEQFVVHRFGFFFLAAVQGFRSAVMEMIAYEVSRDAAESFLNAGYLRDDVGTVAIVLDHFLEAADLAFDAAKAVAIGFLELGVDAHGFARFRGDGTSAVGGARWMGGFTVDRFLYGHRIYPPGLFIPSGAIFVKWPVMALEVRKGSRPSPRLMIWFALLVHRKPPACDPSKLRVEDGGYRAVRIQCQGEEGSELNGLV
jgi:hypothetical protein